MGCCLGYRLGTAISMCNMCKADKLARVLQDRFCTCDMRMQLRAPQHNCSIASPHLMACNRDQVTY